MNALDAGPIPDHVLSRRFGAPERRWLWAYCPRDWLLHLLPPAEVAIARRGWPARAACGQAMPAEGLVFRDGRPAEMCELCASRGASRSVEGDR